MIIRVLIRNIDSDEDAERIMCQIERDYEVDVELEDVYGDETGD